MSSYVKTQERLVRSSEGSPDETAKRTAAAFVLSVNKIQAWYVATLMNIPVFYYTFFSTPVRAHVVYVLYAIYSVVEAAVLSGPAAQIADQFKAIPEDQPKVDQKTAVVTIAVLAALMLIPALLVPFSTIKVIGVGALIYQIRHHYLRARSVYAAKRIEPLYPQEQAN